MSSSKRPQLSEPADLAAFRSMLTDDLNCIHNIFIRENVRLTIGQIVYGCIKQAARKKPIEPTGFSSSEEISSAEESGGEAGMANVKRFAYFMTRELRRVKAKADRLKIRQVVNQFLLECVKIAEKQIDPFIDMVI